MHEKNTQNNRKKNQMFIIIYNTSIIIKNKSNMNSFI